MLQSNITDMAFDPNNFCWISFANGIQKFDGKNFTNVPVQPGLPDDKSVKLFRASNGILFLSHSKGISTYDHSTDKFRVIHSSRTDMRLPAVFLGETNGRIYIYQLNGIIGEIDLRSGRMIHETFTGFVKKRSSQTGFPAISPQIGNRVAFHIDSLIYLWHLGDRKPVYDPVKVSGISPFMIHLLNKSEVGYFSLGTINEFQSYNFEAQEHRVVFSSQADHIRTFRARFYQWGNRQVHSYYNHLYELNSNSFHKLAELVNFQNMPIAGNASISLIREDNFGNLYLVTINDGFRKIIRNNFPIRYYGNGKKDENYSLSLCIDKKNNRVLTGTFGNGVLIYDTMQRLVKHISQLPGEDHTFSITQIIKSENDGYFLFTKDQAWHLSASLNTIRKIPIKRRDGIPPTGVGYFSKLIYQNSDSAVFISQGLHYSVSFKTHETFETNLHYPTAISSIRFKDNIILFENDELFFLHPQSFRVRKKVPLINTGGVRCFTTDDRRTLYVGTNKGVFMLDSSGRIITVLDRKRGLPDECIYAMVLDQQGFLWCSTNKGIFKVTSSNYILQLNREDGLQENEFNTNLADISEDGEIFFAGVNGTSSFYPSEISGFREKISLLLTELRINNDPYKTDRGIWALEKIVLPYNKSSLSFDFIAMASNNPEQYTYQYMMEGVDDEWVQAGQLNTVRYFLSPGKYKFKVYAARYFDARAKPMKEISIIVRPPYWQTWWFLVILGVVFISLMAAGFNRYNKSKYEKRLSQFEAEQKLRLERERISRDLHDSIGAYANAVLYNTELLEEEKRELEKRELMADLKYASKDIITSLRETIWALKKDHYTAEECMMRIRNFIQPFNRYYSKLKFRLEGDAPPGMDLHYTRALNLVRIVQEAVTNSIKHGQSKTITITSRFDPRNWYVIVTDDGNGFILDENTKEGNGLNNIRQRANESNFDVSFESKPGDGTVVKIRVGR